MIQAIGKFRHLPAIVGLIGLMMVGIGCQRQRGDDAQGPGYSSGTQTAGASLSADDFVVVINAINDDDAATVRKMLDRGAAVLTHRLNNNETILSVALRGGARCENVSKLLLTSGADVNAVDGGGTTPLHWAARNCPPDIVKLLIDRGANVKAVDAKGYTPLHASCINNDLAVAKMLVEAGAIVGAKTVEGKTPADLAEWSGRLDIARMLRE